MDVNVKRTPEDDERILYEVVKTLTNPFKQEVPEEVAEAVSYKVHQTTSFDAIVSMLMAMGHTETPSSKRDEVAYATVKKTQELSFDFILELAAYTSRNLHSGVKAYQRGVDDPVCVKVVDAGEESHEIKMARAFAHLQIAFASFIDSRTLWVTIPRVS